MNEEMRRVFNAKRKRQKKKDVRKGKRKRQDRPGLPTEREGFSNRRNVSYELVFRKESLK